MRIEKFEDLAVAIDDEMAIWFRRCGTPHLKDDGHIEFTDIEWVFIGANDGDKRWYIGNDFEAAHPGVLDDILRRLNENG